MGLRESCFLHRDIHTLLKLKKYYFIGLPFVFQGQLYSIYLHLQGLST